MPTFLCFNCKARKPKFGDTKWEIALTIVTITLFLLSFVEIVAFAQYSAVFSSAVASGCCGVIEENSWPADGAVCHEQDIADSQIHKHVFNGSVLCVVNDIVCEDFNYHKQGNMTNLEECLNTGGFPLTDLCDDTLIQNAASHATTNQAAACICLCIIIFSITFAGVCEYIGCFEESRWCQNKFVSIINKLLEIIIWCLLLAISQTVIENTAQNGYSAGRPPASEARSYLYSHCEIQNKSVMWVDFTLNMPEWLNSPAYQYLAAVGVALSIIEFVLFFFVFHKQRINAKSDTKVVETEENVEKTLGKEIEMGGGEENKKDETI